MEIRFTKDGRERLAHSPAEAVQLRADGWKEEPIVQQAEVVEDAPASTETAPKAKVDDEAKN